MRIPGSILLATSFLAFISLNTIAQEDQDINKGKILTVANKALKSGSYYLAIDKYRKVLNVDSSNLEALSNIARAYRLSRNYRKAEKYYRTVWQMAPQDHPIALYYAALMTKMNGDYNEAAVLFQKVDEKDSLFRENNLEEYVEYASVERQGCSFAKRQRSSFPFRTINHLPSHVNSPYSELSPLHLRGDTIIYASLPIDTAIVIEGDKELQDADHIKFYYTRHSENGYTERQRLKQFDEYQRHVANGTYDSLNHRFYYTICRQDKYNDIVCKLYVSTKENGAWSEPQKLPKPVNVQGATTTHPAVGKVNKKDVLFFASKREGSKDGKDLWYVPVKSNQEFGEPIRLSDTINTKCDEATPFYSHKTGQLYFSSNGHVGMGGYDVYKTSFDTGKWQEPENIGPPVNSSVDEMYYSFSEDDEGYFVSNRSGSIAFKHRTCCDDIYRFTYFDAPVLATTIQTGCQRNARKRNLKGASVTLYEKKQDGEEKVIYEDTLSNRANLNFPLQKEKQYRLHVAKDRYFNSSIEFNTMEPISGDTLFKSVCLEKMRMKAYRLKNIYYDFDKWSLRDTSKKRLDSLYTIMQENPDIIVEIGSHTDSRGTDYYNTQLSFKRAESCMAYLINEKSIPVNRLQAAGYGETQKLDNCLQYDECPPDDRSDCPCHQMNRRTEFRIIGKLDGELEYTSPRYNDQQAKP